MKRKAILVLIMMLCLVGTAYAAVFIAPTSSSTISGSKLYNVTTKMAAPVNCSISGSSALNGDSASFFLYNTTSWLNTTRVTTTEEDAADWTFSGTCYNSTYNATSGVGSEAITAISSVIIDNTAPTAPTLTCESEYNNNEDIQYAVTGSGTTACTIYFGANDYAMTHSGDTCTYTVAKNAPADSNYELYATATDGTNTSTSSKCTIRIDALPSGDNTAINIEVASQQAAKQKSGKMVFIIAAVFIVIYLIYKKK